MFADIKHEWWKPREKNGVIETEMAFFGGMHVYVYIQEHFGITRKFYDKNSTSSPENET